MNNLLPGCAHLKGFKVQAPQEAKIYLGTMQKFTKMIALLWSQMRLGTCLCSFVLAKPCLFIFTRSHYVQPNGTQLD